ncbi:MAG: hypothetical protein P5702_12570 [Limnospira sp. PMC 1291.21]|uniref:hypothetical protein n=1 Tax=Limnospira TaxID=2596745 RepID=UPI000280476A|nr:MULTISPECIES: hypothetical protein [unclassified Limnospira]EKD09782.1 hypothetical protein SPLC1_S130190 [Arthrospira platensis C1]MDT9178246.1 hypothetical protein [Limnospira sp. PMC 1238.20]MDT9193581.1 hypothetical protein [Limnospira sp. PMC 1245.20]MDT9203728.1 hypothetical protein [Limnospira sp. PMC 1243.20]MDT9208959.1 hypothetical protein [Limnospira sp. PMC 1252.20]
MMSFYSNEIQLLRTIDWDNYEDAQDKISHALYSIFNNQDKLRDCILKIPQSPELFNKCEHYDILDKLVIYNDPSGFRIRIHLFLPGYIDRPHNHRWAYGSIILSGSYKHFLYLSKEQCLNEKSSLDSLVNIMVRSENVGSSYFLNPNAIHSIKAEPYTVSVIVRGPSVTNKFLVMDKASGDVWWQYGSDQESDKEKQKKLLTKERFKLVCDQLHQLGII